MGPSSQPKKKNNHFVPRSYLKRFCPGKGKQIALYNIAADLIVPRAPIKSQCSRDYFYTKNPVFEDAFGDIEGDQRTLLDEILRTERAPSLATMEHARLMSGILFQRGRTVAAAEQTDELASLFGKALLQKQFEKDGRNDLLSYLPQVKLSVNNAVMDSIFEHLPMAPLIGDMVCSLFLNRTPEDFLTSDHPVILFNSLPPQHTHPAVGFASRGLIVLYPISPRALLFLSDREVYKVHGNDNGAVQVCNPRDVVEMNLGQFGNAFENIYFNNAESVTRSLSAFRKRSKTVRRGPRELTETPSVLPDGRHVIKLEALREAPRLALPKSVSIRRAARVEGYEVGNELVRDPMRTMLVRAELARLQGLRDSASQGNARRVNIDLQESAPD
jgi:hypothetical protein